MQDEAPRANNGRNLSRGLVGEVFDENTRVHCLSVVAAHYFSGDGIVFLKILSEVQTEKIWGLRLVGSGATLHFKHVSAMCRQEDVAKIVQTFPGLILNWSRFRRNM